MSAGLGNATSISERVGGLKRAFDSPCVGRPPLMMAVVQSLSGVRDLQHELGGAFGRKRGHVFLLGLLESRPDATERVGEDQPGVYAVGHYLVEPLAKTVHRLQTAFRFDRTEQFDHP